MDEEMQVLVCHALSGVQKLKEASHACVVFEEESNLESWGSHDDMDMLNNLFWINVTNMYDAEENNTAWSFDSHDMNALCWNKSMERDWLCDTKFGHYVCEYYWLDAFGVCHGYSKIRGQQMVKEEGCQKLRGCSNRTAWACRELVCMKRALKRVARGQIGQ
ncbi:hypothetical protein L7F22_001862 [Adiantum nelumboides]|nr:hypothetical protein [Adiantum nelumboides]